MGAMESVVSLGNASHHLQRLASPGNSPFPWHLPHLLPRLPQLLLLLLQLLVILHLPGD